jgi:hypothetical protein
MVSPQSIVLRPMTSSDLTAVCAIEQQVQYAPWTEKLFSDGLERHLCLVAEKAERLSVLLWYSLWLMKRVY